jgi:hypothetical protein
MPIYQYCPLSNGHNNIRLLRLLPAEAEEAEIRAELVEYKLHESQSWTQRHSYHCLSYVWGNPKPARTVFIGDDFVEITPNLHAALVQLRDHTFPRILWIDAICINQADDDEKALQIRSMAMIYGMASCVLVWLGEAANGSDHALEIIRTGAIDSVKSPEVPEIAKIDNIEEIVIFRVDDTHKSVTPQDVDSLTDVVSLLQREWFERIWVRPKRMSTYVQVLTKFPGSSRSSRCSAYRDHVR